MKEIEPPGAGDQAAPPQAGGKLDPRMIEATNLVLARVREALASNGPGLDSALKADPLAGAVKFGTMALRSIVQAATKAGRNLPLEVVIAAGLQTIKDLAAIANDKGYLPDEQLEPFLKEAFQQSLREWTMMDSQDGKITPEMAAKLKAGAAGAPQPGEPPPPGALDDEGAM